MFRQDAQSQKSGVRPAVAIVSGTVVTLVIGLLCYQWGLSQHLSSERQDSQPSPTPEPPPTIEQPTAPNSGAETITGTSGVYSPLNISRTNSVDAPTSNQAPQPDQKLAAALARIAELESTTKQLQAKKADSPLTNGIPKLTGTWFNTNNFTQGITKVTIPDPLQDDFSITIWTASYPQNIQMPTVRLHRLVTSDSPSFPDFPEGFAAWDLGSRKDYLLVHFHPDGICTELVIVDQKPVGIKHTGFYLMDSLKPGF